MVLVLEAVRQSEKQRNGSILLLIYEHPENYNGDSRMPFPILCIILYFRLQACAFGL